MATLTREKVEVVRVECSMAKEAAELLGYKAMQYGTESAAMLQWLYDHDIRPFTPASVEKYKRVKRDEANAPALNWWMMWVKVAAVCVLVSVVCFGLASIYRPSIAWGISIASLILSLCGLLFSGLQLFESSVYEWWNVEFHNFRGQVPEFVVQTALDIKQAFPNAKLQICELSEWHDPFLVLVLPDGRELYIEVWNEPGFNRQREV